MRTAPLLAAHEVEAIADDALDDERIRGRRQARPNADIELPVLAEVEIQHAEEQVLLVARAVDVAGGPIAP